MNLKNFLPVVLSSSNTSEPVISDGIKSGVNWTLLNFKFRTSESVLTRRVFASPGTPTKSE